MILLLSQSEVNIIFSLTALLRSEGHTVEFVKTKDRDEVELVVHGETIYWCKIQDLQYGKLPKKGWCLGMRYSVTKSKAKNLEVWRVHNNFFMALY